MYHQEETCFSNAYEELPSEDTKDAGKPDGSAFFLKSTHTVLLLSSFQLFRSEGFAAAQTEAWCATVSAIKPDCSFSVSPVRKKICLFSLETHRSDIWLDYSVYICARTICSFRFTFLYLSCKRHTIDSLQKQNYVTIVAIKTQKQDKILSVKININIDK